MRRTIEVARTSPAKLANKINAAAPYLFAFLRHPGVQPTNNHAERELRRPILRRKVSGQTGSVEGMHRFGVLFTRLLARTCQHGQIWKRRQAGGASKTGNPSGKNPHKQHQQAFCLF